MKRRHSGVGSISLGASAMLVFVLVLGCSAEKRLPDQPSAEQVIAAAIDWIEAADCQAIASSAPVAKQGWVWRFQKGGKVAVGVNGAIVIDGDALYLKIDEEIEGGAVSSTAPLWLRLSPGDFPDAASIEKAQPVFRTWTELLMTNPLLCMREIKPESTVEDSADGTAWVITGSVREVNVLGRFVTPEGAAHAAELGYMLPLVPTLTLTVERETGAPLATDIALALGDPNSLSSWHWQRGIWLPPEVGTVGPDEYLRGLGE